MIELKTKDTPREFGVGQYCVRDWGTIRIVCDSPRTNEFITVESGSGRRCDISATSWGFYLGPSINGRLKEEGFRTAITVGAQGKIYFMAVEIDKLDDFKEYLKLNQLRVVCWADEWFVQGSDYGRGIEM